MRTPRKPDHWPFGESCDQINKDLFPEVTFDNGPLRIKSKER